MFNCSKDSFFQHLRDHYHQHFSHINEEYIAHIMYQCCYQFQLAGRECLSWLEFYESMKIHLNEEQHPQTLQKIEELIANYQPQS